MIGSYNGKDNEKAPKAPRTFRTDRNFGGYAERSARSRILVRASVTDSFVQNSALQNPLYVEKRAIVESGAYSRSDAKRALMYEIKLNVATNKKKPHVFTGAEWNTILPMEPIETKKEDVEEFPYVKLWHAWV